MTHPSPVEVHGEFVATEMIRDVFASLRDEAIVCPSRVTTAFRDVARTNFALRAEGAPLP